MSNTIIKLNDVVVDADEAITALAKRIKHLERKLKTVTTERDALSEQLADANRQISQLKTAAVQVDAALGKLKERDDYVERCILADFYGEVCDEADRIMEQTNMVSGAHWNAMKRVLARKGMKVDAEVGHD